MGFLVHEITPASKTVEFLGLELHESRFRVKAKRMWRLRRAWELIITRKHCSGAMLEIILGH
eukprot:9616963-Karenia_brevis.AAC.1